MSSCRQVSLVSGVRRWPSSSTYRFTCLAPGQNLDRTSYLYIYFDCLSVCIKYTNGWTGRAKILCGTTHDSREGFRMLKITKICIQKFFIFVKFWKCAKNIIQFANFFIFLFCIVQRRCSQKELKLKVKIY